MPRTKKRFTACRDGANATVERFYEFKNWAETTVDLYFYGDIVSDWCGAWQEEDQYPDAIKNFLAEAGGKDLNIYINSGGGSVLLPPFLKNRPMEHAHGPIPSLPLRTAICQPYRQTLI